jgi:hypothetical protein
MAESHELVSNRIVRRAAAMLAYAGKPDAEALAKAANAERRLTISYGEIEGRRDTIVEIEFDLEVVGAAMEHDLFEGVKEYSEDARVLSVRWTIECPVCSYRLWVEQEAKPNHDVIGVARTLPGHGRPSDEGAAEENDVCPGTNGPAIIHPHPVAVDHSGHRDHWGWTTYMPLDDT